MRDILRRIGAVCLLMALLTTGIMTVQAATLEEVANGVTLCRYFDPEAREVQDNVLPAVQVQINGVNCVFTSMPPKDGLVTIVLLADGENWATLKYLDAFSESLYLYYADSGFGEAEGFYPTGTVTKDASVTMIFFDGDTGKLKAASATATGYQNEKLTLSKIPDMFVPAMVVNSEFEVCAVIDVDGCFPLITDEETFYGGSQETKPAETQPPATQPPATQPPETQPSEEEEPPMIKIAGELPERDELFKNAVKREEPSSNLGTLAIAGVCVLVVILAVAVVLVKRKNAKADEQSSSTLNEAEEGTQLAEDFVDTGLRLQFRNGNRIAVRQNITIGRAPDNGVVIAQQSTNVSGHHCGIVLQNGCAFLRDMGSTNGTFVGGRRIAAGQLVPLQPGMRVSLGGANSPECFDVVLSSKLTGKQ